MALIVGIKHIRDGLEPQAALKADMSILGIIGTAPDADEAKIPLNTAVAMRTSDAALRLALGSTGTLPQALSGISAQLANVGAARCVIVRVEHNADAKQVIANIVGSEATKTGVWQFLEAPEDLGWTPRLLIAPGYTSQTSNGVGAVTITDGGTGYVVGDAISGTGGAGAGFAATVATVDGSGKILSVNISDHGAGYTSAPALSVTSTAGENATLTATIDQFANGVCAVMPTILDRLKANFLPEGPTNTRQAALDWYETLPRHAGIMHPLRQDAKVLDAEGNVVTAPLSPYIVAKYVARDAEFDGVPGRSIANQNINGLVGVAPTIPMSITDESALGQEDIGVGFGIVFRGDVGVDGALTDGGYTFWGTDNTSEASEWRFVNVKRMRDYLELMQVKAIRYYLGRFNLTVQTVDAILNTLKSQAVQLRAGGHILDFRLGYEPDENSPEELRLGNIAFVFKAEEPPVLRKITIHSRRYREALTDLSNRISVLLGDYI